jgi:transcription elongation factor Elf1
MPESKIKHVVGDAFVVGNVFKCIRCGHLQIVSELYEKVNILTEKPMMDEKGS